MSDCDPSPDDGTRVNTLLAEWNTRCFDDEFSKAVETAIDALTGASPNSDLGDEIGDAVQEAILALQHARMLRHAELSYAMWLDVEEGRA